MEIKKSIRQGIRSRSCCRFCLRGLIVLALLFGGLAWPAGTVQAHANLVQSNPTPGQVLAIFPATAELDFSEAVSPGSARVQLINAAGLVVGDGKINIDPAAPQVVRVDLPAQPNGVYRLAWAVQSAVDGHITTGSLAFSVGLNGPRASLLPPPGTPDPATSLPAAWEVLLRWLGYGSIALAAGSALFGVWIWRPAYRTATDLNSQVRQVLDARVLRLLRGLILAGAVGAVISVMGITLGQTLANEIGSTESFGLLLLHNLLHDQGEMFWIRLIVLPLIFIMASMLPGPGSGPARPWWEICGLGGILAITFSLRGHNASLGSPLPILGDWLHIAGMAAWVGGLLPLGVLLHGQRQEHDLNTAPLFAQVVRRFSRLATIAVVVLGLSGLYSALLQVRTLAALTETRYGQALLIKTGLFALLIGLGALNQLGWIPRLAKSGHRIFGRLASTVRLEFALGVLVLLAAGTMMSLSPAYQALQADYRVGLHETYQTDNVSFDFRVAPGVVGEDEFGLDVIDRRPGADTVQPTALLRISAVDADLGTTQVELKPASGDRYSARGSFISQMGVWQAEVIWRKSGFDDVTHVFSIDLPQLAANRGEKVNPVPADISSIEGGRALYTTDCAPCHGMSGKGDGPAGQALSPAPADLTVHGMPGVHTDGELFNWISNGYPGSAMPAFAGQLTEKQRWDLVNFLRALAQQK